MAALVAADPAAQTGDDYERWINAARTPADAVAYVLAQAQGFQRVDPARDAPRKVAPGQRLAFISRDRMLLLVHVGRQPPSSGFHLIGSHIDTPSIRLEPRANGSAIFATRYGGAKPYHWAGIPLALRGRAALPDGRVVSIVMGDPAHGDRFSFSARLREGERYEIEGDPLALLKKRYGLGARDLAAAEIFAVPARGARRVGLDRALIGAHGHDDRACSFATWKALLDLDRTPARTAMALLVDREEVGSTGAAGAHSEFLVLAVSWLLRATGASTTTPDAAFARSRALSSDVTAGVDPLFPTVYELRNAPRMGAGPCLLSNLGHLGKLDNAHPSAEWLADLRRLYRVAGVPLQYGEIGRVDEGGGGTISADLAALGLAVIDIGVPVVSMHSPFELVAVRDLYDLRRGDRAFYESP